MRGGNLVIFYPIFLCIFLFRLILFYPRLFYLLKAFLSFAILSMFASCLGSRLYNIIVAISMPNYKTNIIK